MTNYDAAHFRATAGNSQALGATPQEALRKLMRQLKSRAETPIVIWPYNHGDAYFSEDQNARLQRLKARVNTLTLEERREMEALVEASFDLQ